MRITAETVRNKELERSRKRRFGQIRQAVNDLNTKSSTVIECKELDADRIIPLFKKRGFTCKWSHYECGGRGALIMCIEDEVSK